MARVGGPSRFAEISRPGGWPSSRFQGGLCRDIKPRSKAAIEYGAPWSGLTVAFPPKRGQPKSKRVGEHHGYAARTFVGPRAQLRRPWCGARRSAGPGQHPAARPESSCGPLTATHCYGAGGSVDCVGSNMHLEVLGLPNPAHACPGLGALESQPSSLTPPRCVASLLLHGAYCLLRRCMHGHARR
jgi:hypothetical protein